MQGARLQFAEVRHQIAKSKRGMNVFRVECGEHNIRHPGQISTLLPPGAMRPIGSVAWSAICASLRQNEVFMNERENIAGTSTLETQDIGIDGMTCDNCVRTVEKALRGVNGVTEVRVNRPAALATVTFDTTKTHIPQLHDALLKSGYRPSARPVD